MSNYVKSKSNTIDCSLLLIGCYQKKQIGINFYSRFTVINLASGASIAQLKAQWHAMVEKYVCYCE